MTQPRRPNALALPFQYKSYIHHGNLLGRGRTDWFRINGDEKQSKAEVTKEARDEKSRASTLQRFRSFPISGVRREWSG